MYFSWAIHFVDCAKIFLTYFSTQDEFSRHFENVEKCKEMFTAKKKQLWSYTGAQRMVLLKMKTFGER